MRRDVPVRASVDAEAAGILDELAKRETEGNRSQMLRIVIREAGARRGLWDPQERPPERPQAVTYA